MYTPLTPGFDIEELGCTWVKILKHRLWTLVRSAPAKQILRLPTTYVLEKKTICSENVSILTAA